MEIIKVIDLLNKMANGEEVPKEIKTEEDIYEYVDIAYDYKKKCDSLNYWFFQQFVFGGNGNCLNYEVEIIEEPKEIEGFVVNNHRHVHNENGLSIFPIEEDKEAEIIDETAERMKHYKCTYNKEIKEYEFELKTIEPLKLNYSGVWTGITNEELIINKINELIDVSNEHTKVFNELKKEGK